MSLSGIPCVQQFTWVRGLVQLLEESQRLTREETRSCPSPSSVMNLCVPNEFELIDLNLAVGRDC